MSAAEKVDLKRTLDGFRARRGEFRTLRLPPLRYLAVDGAGDPNTSPAYADALAALYPAAYAVKFHSRAVTGRDYVVPPLEALWWAEDMAAFTERRDKSAWSWTVLLMVPDWVVPDVVAQAVAGIAPAKRPAALELVHEVELDEGLCVQTLHVGSYDDEAPVLERMHTEHIAGAGLELTGRHHEIYLSDPRRVPADRLRTILRQPVRPTTPHPT